MEIKTKFDINDEVWFLHPQSQKAVSGRIKEINIRIGGNPKYRTGDRRDRIATGEYEKRLYSHSYQIDDQIRREGIGKSEYDLFLTKEELKESLKTKISSL